MPWSTSLKTISFILFVQNHIAFASNNSYLWKLMIRKYNWYPRSRYGMLAFVVFLQNRSETLHQMPRSAKKLAFRFHVKVIVISSCTPMRWVAFLISSYRMISGNFTQQANIPAWTKKWRELYRVHVRKYTQHHDERIKKCQQLRIQDALAISLPS